MAGLLITALDAVLEVWISLFFGVAGHSTGPDSDIAPECALFPLRSSLLRTIRRFRKDRAKFGPLSAYLGYLRE